MSSKLSADLAGCRDPELDRAPGRGASSRWANLMLAGVMLLSMLVYLRCLGNSFVWDDNQLIVNNGHLAQWSFFRQSFVRDFVWFGLHKPRYRPLLLAWFGLNYHLFGLNPAGWHAAMIGLHMIVVWMVFNVTVRVAGDRNIALVTALLFGVIPINAESVIWPGGGGGLVLAAVFELGAFYLFIAPAGARGRSGLLAPILYATALLAHEAAASFPVLIAAYILLSGPLVSGSPDASRRARSIEPRAWRAAVGAAPFAGVLIVYLIVLRLVLGSIISWTGETLTSAQALLTVPKALCADLGLLAIPWLADPVHPIAIVTSAWAPDFYLPLFALIALLGLSVLALRKGARARSRVFWAAWIVIAIVPTMALGSRRQDNIVCDSYLYLSAVGSCALIADLIDSVARSARATRLAPIAAGALALSYGGALWHVQRFWLNDEVLSSHGLERAPDAPIWHAGLAAALSHRGDTAGAERELQKALSLAPGDVETLYSLGLVHAQMGRTTEAAREISDAVTKMRYPSADIYLPLANLHQMEGSLNAAEQDLHSALNLDPGNVDALYALGLLHWRMGRLKDATIEISTALKLTPNPRALDYMTLARIYNAQGDRAQAEDALERAATLPGGELPAEVARADIELKSGDRAAAEKTLRAVAARHPDDARLPTMLGLLLTAEDRDQEALASYRRAMTLAPADSRPRLFAAQLLHKMGRDGEALDLCHAAVLLGNADAQALIAEIKHQAAPH